MARKEINSEFQDEQVLKKCFDCLVLFGLERTSMRDFCLATKLSTSSLYYRFEDKDEIVLESAYFGLTNITKELFWAAVVKIKNYTELFDSILSNVELRKARIRLIYQIATSPQYGDAFRKKASHIANVYATYTDMISEHIGCSSSDLQPYVNLFIASIREYIVWENKERLAQELKHIYAALTEHCVNKPVRR